MKENLASAINDFLKSQGIIFDVVVEDQSTLFWSYPIPECRCFGWISIYDNAGTAVIGASINFGQLNLKTDVEASRALLESNSKLVGMYYACQSQSLIVIGFSDEIRFLNKEVLTFRLRELHKASYASFERFVENENLLEPLPTSWFEDGWTK